MWKWAKELPNSFRSFVSIWKACFLTPLSISGCHNLHIVLQRAAILLTFPVLSSFIFFLILLGKLIHVISLWNLWHLTAQALRGTLLWLELTLIAWLVSNTWRKRTSCWDHCQGYGGVWGLLMESGLSQVYRTVLKQSWKVSFGKWCCQLCFLAFFFNFVSCCAKNFRTSVCKMSSISL